MDELIADVLKAIVQSVHGTTETATKLFAVIEDAVKAAKTVDTEVKASDETQPTETGTVAGTVTAPSADPGNATISVQPFSDSTAASTEK